MYHLDAVNTSSKSTHTKKKAHDALEYKNHNWHIEKYT